MHILLEAEGETQTHRNKILEMVKVPRNRRALIASEIVMFMQQVSGGQTLMLAINDLTYLKVLRSKCNRLLLVTNLPRRRLQSNDGTLGVSGLRADQLDFRSAGHLYD